MAASGRVRFLGIDFDQASTDSAADEILAAGKLPFRYVVTPNVHHVVKIHETGDAGFARYADAWKIYCDSRVLSQLARVCGLNLSVVTGSDLTAVLIRRASDLKLKITIVGPSAEDCAILARHFPGLDMSSYTPPMGFIASDDEVKKCVDFVLCHQAELVFLAVGMPQQEILAQRIAQHAEARGVGLCIGASIDFLTAKQQRAPLWVQRLGLEWMHRLLSDPKRLARRYLIECPRIFPLIIAHVRDTRSRDRSPAA